VERAPTTTTNAELVLLRTTTLLPYALFFFFARVKRARLASRAFLRLIVAYT